MDKVQPPKLGHYHFSQGARHRLVGKIEKEGYTRPRRQNALQHHTDSLSGENVGTPTTPCNSAFLIESYSNGQELASISRAREGDQTAFEGLMRHYEQFVQMRARSFFLQGAGPEDLLQEGMIGLFKAVRDYRPDVGSFKPFAELCITRQIITAVRNASRLKHIPLNTARSIDASSLRDGEKSLHDILADHRSSFFTSRFFDTEEFQSVLNTLRQALSKFEFTLLSLWLEGDSYQEIATQLGTKLKSVNNGLWRAKSKMRRLLEKGGLTLEVWNAY